MKHAESRFHLSILPGSGKRGALLGTLLPASLGLSSTFALTPNALASPTAPRLAGLPADKAHLGAPTASLTPLLSSPTKAEAVAALPSPLKWSVNDPLYKTNKAAFHKDEGNLRLLELTPRAANGKVSFPEMSSGPVLSTVDLALPQELAPFIIAPLGAAAPLDAAAQPQIIEIQQEAPAADDAPEPPPADLPVPSDAELQAKLDSLDQRLDKVATQDLDPISLVLPSISSNVPSAYGASAGTYAFGFGFQNGLRFKHSKEDGTVSGVIGLGDPRKLGIDIQVSSLDLSRFSHNPSLGFKLHRQLPHDYTVAFGGENALVKSISDSGSSYYAVVSKKVRLLPSSSEPNSRLYLSLGVGNGRFQSESDVFNNKHGINVFGSAAVNITKTTTGFVEWTGQTVNAGASFSPLPKLPFVFTLAMADLVGPAGDGSRFTAGIGYVMTR